MNKVYLWTQPKQEVEVKLTVLKLSRHVSGKRVKIQSERKGSNLYVCIIVKPISFILADYEGHIQRTGVWLHIAYNYCRCSCWGLRFLLEEDTACSFSDHVYVIAVKTYSET